MPKMTNSEIRKMVQAKILEALDKGVNPWRKQWTPDVSSVPHNCISGHVYRGVNVPYLFAIQTIEEYATSQWLTYNQARKAGGHVRKGEKAKAYVIFTKRVVFTDRDENGDEEKTPVFLMRVTPVFNIAQCDDVELPKRETIEPVEYTPNELIESVQAFMSQSGANVTYNGAVAAYNPPSDTIKLPRPELFESPEAFASTALHETIHWTGHVTRCKRTGIVDFKGFGTPHYAREELVAELGSAMLCERFNVSNETENHASYIDNWITLIKHDDRAIFTAAKAAEAAMDYLDEIAALKKAA